MNGLLILFIIIIIYIIFQQKHSTYNIPPTSTSRERIYYENRLLSKGSKGIIVRSNSKNNDIMPYNN